MDKGSQLLSDVTVYDKYARYNEKLGRREVYKEIIDRNKQMHLDKFKNHPKFYELEMLIDFSYEYVYNKRVLPSMRSLQYAGEPISRQNIRIFNCSFREISDLRAFDEILYLLLMGCGVGYSVQQHHVAKLPKCPKVLVANTTHVIEDSAEGWATAIRVLIEMFFQSTRVDFDYSQIRPAGTKLQVSGGLAPGHEILKKVLDFIVTVLISRRDMYLRPIDCHSICCSIAECVLSGGNRRSALISLFSETDEDMMNCKSGEWLKTNPHFAYSNNSVVLERDVLTRQMFYEIVEKSISSGFGEPGFYITNNKEYGCNPCCEAALENKTCCNLTTINADLVVDKKDALNCVMAATIIGTLQATYTDQTYLDEEWKSNIERDALLGVSFTGIASNKLDVKWLRDMGDTAKRINKTMALLLGINPAKRIGLIKPEGTSSCLLGTSSGIHPYFSKYYIRRMRLNKLTGIYKYFKVKTPRLLEDCNYNPNDAVICIPIKAPDGALVTADDGIVAFMRRIQDYYNEWVVPTHSSGDNTHNISCTLHYTKNEEAFLPMLLYTNINNFNGITIFPSEDNKYSQAPFEEITQATYYRYLSYIPDDIDFTFAENTYIDNEFTKRTGCDGAKCEYTHKS